MYRKFIPSALLLALTAALLVLAAYVPNQVAEVDQAAEVADLGYAPLVDCMDDPRASYSYPLEVTDVAFWDRGDSYYGFTAHGRYQDLGAPYTCVDYVGPDPVAGGWRVRWRAVYGPGPFTFTGNWFTASMNESLGQLAAGSYLLRINNTVTILNVP